MLRECRMKGVPVLSTRRPLLPPYAIVSITIVSIAHPRARGCVVPRQTCGVRAAVSNRPGCRCVAAALADLLLLTYLHPRSTGGWRREAHLESQWKAHLVKVCGAGQSSGRPA